MLQNDYDKVIRDQRNNKAILVDKLEKNVGVQIMQNNTFYIKARTHHHSGWYFNNGAAGADLNTGEPTYNELQVPARYGYGTHQITDTALVSMQGQPGAIVDIAADFARAVKEQLRKEKNRQWLGLGGTEANNASLGTVNGAVSGTTVILENIAIGGSAAGTTDDAPRLGTRFLKPGDVLDIGTDAEIGAGTAEAVTVSTVDSITTFTAGASETLVDGDNVVKSGADNNEMNGFKNVVATGNTFQNIARSTNFWAQAQIDNTSEALSEEDMINTLLSTNDKNGEVNVIIAGLVMYHKYASLLSSMKRTATSKESLLGGFKGLEFAAGAGGNDIVVLLDHDASFGDVWFPSLMSDYISVGVLGEGWLGPDQGVGIFEKTNLRPSYWATYRFYGNLAVRGMSAHGGLRRKTA